MKETLKEFKNFAIKGNAFDLAVGVVIGAAFGKIVSSIVEDLINPLIGWATGGIDFSDKSATLIPSIGDIPALTLNYGLFLTALINFIIVAFAIFIIVKQVNRLKRKEEAKPSEPTKPSNQEVLLAEIRDLLKK